MNAFNVFLTAVLGLVGVNLLTQTDPSEPGKRGSNVSVQTPWAEVDVETIELPDDGKEWAVLVFTRDDWRQRPSERRVVSWFQGGDSGLTRLASKVNFYHYTQSDPMYRERFKPAYGDNFPVVAVQAFDGASHVKVSGKNVPEEPRGLVRHIARRLNKLRPIRAIKIRHAGFKTQDCVDGQCDGRERRPWLRPWRWGDGNQPEPSPDTEPPPIPDRAPAPQDETIEETASEPEGETPANDSTLLGLLVALGGAVAGGLSRLK